MSGTKIEMDGKNARVTLGKPLIVHPKPSQLNDKDKKKDG